MCNAAHFGDKRKLLLVIQYGKRNKVQKDMVNRLNHQCGGLHMLALWM
jgi:hypothetical protein